MFNINLTEEQRVQKSAVAIMAHKKWADTGGVLMLGERRVCDTTPTAYTNGKDVVFGREAVAKWSDPELRFVDLHEQQHKFRRHLITWLHLQNLDAHIANVAMDMVINLDITERDAGEGFVKMPEGGCYDEKYKGWDTAKVFYDLYDSNEDGSGSGGTGISGEPLDEHGWAEAKDMTAEEVKELEREIDAAIRQGNLLGSKLGSGGDRLFGDLLAPQINWKDVLLDFVMTACQGTDESTWRRPNRRFAAHDMYMPSTYSESIKSIVFAADMSGSIGDREQAVMLSETVSAAAVAHPEELHIIYWDTKVCQHEVYEGNELETIQTDTKPKGGGGTDVECVPPFMEANNITPECVVVFTDGYLGGDWGNWTCPVLWVIIDNKSAVPTSGTVLHVKSSDLR
jgi:predicted metal-dependent peptidase